MKHNEYTAPISLGGLFPNSDEEDNTEFCNEMDIIQANFGHIQISIRQMAWHGANANQIWPGSYTLVDFLLANKKYSSGRFLELGSATGAVSIAIIKAKQLDIITSDIDDGGVVEENIKWNFTNNDVQLVRHIAHTWGSGWHEKLGLRYIVASDILLYVSAYDALVKTLVEIFELEAELEEFAMSWNRRIAESELFFNKMRDNGFVINVHGKGMFTIIRSNISS